MIVSWTLTKESEFTFKIYCELLIVVAHLSPKRIFTVCNSFWTYVSRKFPRKMSQYVCDSFSTRSSLTSSQPTTKNNRKESWFELEPEVLFPQDALMALRASKFLLVETTMITRKASLLEREGLRNIALSLNDGGYGGSVGRGGGRLSLALCTGRAGSCFTFSFIWCRSVISLFFWTDSSDEQSNSVTMLPVMKDATLTKMALVLRKRIIPH